MNLPDHSFGCTCARHRAGAWDRSEHWSRRDVLYLEGAFGRVRDETIAKKLGRTVVGIRLKAKRLGLRKKDAGHTGRDVARTFGVDLKTVTRWIDMGLLSARRAPWSQGPKPVWLIGDRDVDLFIRRHPECIDVRKMPESPWRDLAAKDPWISIPEAHRRTGRNGFAIAVAIRYGILRGRRRGIRGLGHWYIPEADIAKIPPLSAEAIDESWFRRQSNLEVRRNRRKGVHGARAAT